MSLDRMLVEALREHSTPTILNGLKRLGLPPAQFKLMDRHMVHCISPDLGVQCGFAVTRKIATRREGGPGQSIDCGPDQGLLAIPGPRFLVVENIGEWQGPVCIWGELTSHINRALDCQAGVTNGPVRDVPEMERLGFQSFANGIATGGGFVDLIEINVPVNVGGITVSPGDLIHGDRHGIVNIPIELAAQLPAAIAEHTAWEKQIFDICTADALDLDALQRAMAPRG